MTNKMRLVQHDTGPSLVFTLANSQTGVPINVAGCTVVMHLRRVGSTEIKETLQLTLRPGVEMRDWKGAVALSFDAPYDVAGYGGRVQLDWTETALDEEGRFEGEVEVTLQNGRRFSIDRLARFQVRKDFA
jgi:hypothetical protein